MNTADTITENPNPAQTSEPREYLIGLALQPLTLGSATLGMQMLVMELVYQAVCAAGVPSRNPSSMIYPPAIVVMFETSQRNKALRVLKDLILNRWPYGLWDLAWWDGAERIWRNYFSTEGKPFDRHLTPEREKAGSEFTRARLQETALLIEEMNRQLRSLGHPGIEYPEPPLEP